MSCIVAYKKNGHVWMGGDSFSGNSSYSLLSANSKVIKRKHGEATILLGDCGTHRGGGLLRSFELPQINFDDDLMGWLEDTFASELRKHLKEHGFLHIEENIEGFAGDQQFLLATQGRIFSIWDDFSVVETSHPYMAIGAGMCFALGALSILHFNTDKEPELIVSLALEAAARHNPFVSGPFDVISDLE